MAYTKKRASGGRKSGKRSGSAKRGSSARRASPRSSAGRTQTVKVVVQLAGPGSDQPVVPQGIAPASSKPRLAQF